MAKTERETYLVPRLRYRIPLAAGLIILVSGIIMTMLDHHDHARSSCLWKKRGVRTAH